MELSGYTISSNDIVNILKKFTPQKTNKDKVRIGRRGDGGYVLLNDFNFGGVVYSFGVGNKHDFEIDMCNRGYTNYMYDHTVNGYSIPKSPNFVFNKIGLAAKSGGQFKNIPTILTDNAHQYRNDIILQCDIEGAEWDIFSDIDQKYLKCFSQICIEFHWLEKELVHNFDKVKSTIDAITENFTSYHIHGNNYRSVFSVNGVTVPDVLEVSFIRNDLVEFSVGEETYPTNLDSPNKSGRPDIQLGKFCWDL